MFEVVTQIRDFTFNGVLLVLGVALLLLDFVQSVWVIARGERRTVQHDGSAQGHQESAAEVAT